MIVVKNKQRNSIITFLKILTCFNRKYLETRKLLNTFAKNIIAAFQNGTKGYQKWIEI